MPSNNLAFKAPGLDIYFQSQRAKIEDQIATHLVQFIQGAKKSLDCAIYDLKHPDVLTGLKKAASRVKLRIAYDGGKTKTVMGGLAPDPKFSGTAQAIQAEGLSRYATAIHVTGGHLMHDKFIVRDGNSVWTGSGNFTLGGLEMQDNNFLSIASPALAAMYTAVLNGMLQSNHNQSHTPKGGKPGAPSKPIKVGAVPITLYFSTGVGENENVDALVVSALKTAKKVRVIAMLISDPDILRALSPFKNKDIKGVLDPHEMKNVMTKSKQNPAWFWFAKGDKRFVAAPSHAISKQNAGMDNHDLMHNKVMIIDDKTVVTGSYNFSENAEKNDENVLVIQSPAIAATYTKYFDALFAQYTKHGAPLPPP